VQARQRLILIGITAACGLASASVMAAEPTNAGQGAKKGLYRTAFVRGDASSKAKRHVAPRTEREALARRTLVANGIVGMELPEDRMVNLVQVRRPDGTFELREEAATPSVLQASAAPEVPRE
jgi:hypothetical protein